MRNSYLCFATFAYFARLRETGLFNCVYPLGTEMYSVVEGVSHA
jgi:hypothetical protein